MKYYAISIFLMTLGCCIPKVQCFNNNDERNTTNYTMEHCNFKHGSFKCIIVGKALEDGVVAVYNHLNLNIMDVDATACNFLTKEGKHNEDERIWCLALSSFHISFIATNNEIKNYDFVYSTYFTNIFLSTPHLEMQLKYQNLSIAHGYIKLPKHCNITRLDKNCTKNFNITLKSILPKQDDISSNKTLVNFLFVEKDPCIIFIDYIGDKGYENIKSVRKYLFKMQSLKISGTSISKSSQQQTFFNDDLRDINEFIALSKIHIEVCFLEDIPDDLIATTQKFKKLTSLNLNRNIFTKVPDGIRFLTNLEELFLSAQKSDYLNLNVSIFQNIIKLKILDISSNKLNFPITRLTLPDLPNLQNLILVNCSIQTVSEDAFINFPNILFIRLSWNKIHSIHPNAFLHVPSNSIVLFNNNRLGNNLLLNITSIGRLNLVNNNISDVTTIINKGNINILLLDYNPIVAWTAEDAFVSKNYRIKRLSMANNLIRTITKEMGISLNKLRRILIDGNPYDCSLCSLEDFKSWLNNSSNIIHSFSHIFKPDKNLFCAFPEEQKNVFILNATLSHPELCLLPNYYIKYGIPPFIIILIIILISFILYAHRTKILFLYHIRKLRKMDNYSTHESEENFDFDVFVSYSSKDRSWVIDTLVPALETPQEDVEKYTLCLHERDFALGSYIMDNVIASIEKSRRVILILSPNFIKSQWCQWELHLAQHKLFEQNRPNFLILIEKETIDRSSLPLHLRTLMGTRTYFEWPQLEPVFDDMIEDFWTKLRLALGTPLPVVKQEEQEDEVEAENDDDLAFIHL